ADISGTSKDDVVRAVELTKTYLGCRTASVRDLTFSVRAGECFGLLGVNGAGKTSTFRMLTGDLAASRGRALVAGLDVHLQAHQARALIGYCPQFDALHENLTVKETLLLYARLRGYSMPQLAVITDTLIEQMSLSLYCNKIVAKLSGGNRRKLSSAVALIGRPRVVFFDEPTSGMDPGAKRFLWRRIAEALQDGQAVVLTSHSMEECEALCHRLGIMVNGQFQCLGSPQHIKDCYGNGYTIEIRYPELLNSSRQETSGGPVSQTLSCIHSIADKVSKLEDQHLDQLPDLSFSPTDRHDSKRSTCAENQAYSNLLMEQSCSSTSSES
ncbi:unnamed protein product, partial [Protopolystoma xenopodis]